MGDKNSYNLRSIYYVPAMDLSPLYELSHIIITQLHEERTMSAPSKDEGPEALKLGVFIR